MTREEAKKFLQEHAFDKRGRLFLKSIKIRYPEIWKKIKSIVLFVTGESKEKDSERAWAILNDVYEVPLCEHCKINKVPFYVTHYRKVCSKKCSLANKVRSEKIMQTRVLRYGSRHYNNTAKMKQTKLLRHGDANYSNREKAELTCLERYGVTNPSQREDVKIKKRKTLEKHYNCTSFNKGELGVLLKKALIKKYGVDNAMKCKEVSDRSRYNHLKTIFKKGMIVRSIKVDAMFTEEEFATKPHCDENGVRVLWKWRCKTCGLVFEHKWSKGEIPVCPDCKKSKWFSKPCNELVEYLRGIGVVNLKVNDRSTIFPKELDILIRDKKLAIEFNGIFHHSEIGGTTSRDYHLNKLEKCLIKGMKLFHIFEDDWKWHKKEIKSELKKMLGFSKFVIDSNKCEVRQIDIDLKKKFLNKYHLHENDQSSICLGVFYKNRLIAVMTFCKSKRANDNKLENEYEILRFSTINNFNIIDAQKPLLTYFENNWKPTKVHVNIDRHWDINNRYVELGFNFIRTSSPNYWYVARKGRKEHRMYYQKHMLQEKLEKFDPELTEWENMVKNGYDRIWDCGTILYEKNFLKSI